MIVYLYARPKATAVKEDYFVPFMSLNCNRDLPMSFLSIRTHLYKGSSKRGEIRGFHVHALIVVFTQFWSIILIDH